MVTITNGVLASNTVNLSGLNDGTITTVLHLKGDAAGNLFTNVVTKATLDQDIAEQAALSVTVNGGVPIGAAKAGAVPFTVAGVEKDDNGTVSFSDGSHAPVVVNIVNGVPAVSTVNLSGFNDGTITATLHLNNDTAGNSFTDVVATAVLDQDKVVERPSLSTPSALTVAAGGSIPLGIVISGVDSDDVLSVQIEGVPSFESVTAAGTTPVITKQGATYTYTFNALPSSDWNNGLILSSSYAESGQPTNVLTVVLSNTAAGESTTAPAGNITVTDPPVGNPAQMLAAQPVTPAGDIDLEADEGPGTSDGTSRPMKIKLTSGFADFTLTGAASAAAAWKKEFVTGLAGKANGVGSIRVVL
jgi:hypothetical protein